MANEVDPSLVLIGGTLAVVEVFSLKALNLQRNLSQRGRSAWEIR